MAAKISEVLRRSIMREKKYDPLDQTMKFVDRKNELDPMDSDEDEDSLRAEMSCGHAVSPESLAHWCRSQLDEGNYEFRCPALVEGTKQCNKVWTYQEVRRLADLSPEEMQHFEVTMARLTVQQYSENQPCPQCKTIVTRMDLSNLCVQCPICTADKGQVYLFCWQCMKPWKGRAPRSKRCNNKGCVNKDLELLRTCKLVSLPQVQGADSCPSIRACPTCGLRVEHNQEYCKNLHCPRCKISFCFICLKLKSECKGTPYKMCPDGVAPRQTAIPKWKRK
ncbi:probable E3 ubiquitin-protein ligase RNF217 [Gouania willdenowi]|uniref:Probable E3 ubiquitin-protein ligase RNF217 n=1 Tax=Gouania willdenowi TaxID=441366 RepID=A0A8C5EUQ2_GOUWI|nr:probable E3 ubiquitin-protein ligase RNF217 [Gouania willdenowi]XP_028330387.1 probable E3 ubiquitin-protein ligase RNF217 [Gouania willdenowi]